MCFSTMDRTIQFRTRVRSISAPWIELSFFPPVRCISAPWTEPHLIMSHNLTVNRNSWLFSLDFLSLHTWWYIHCSSQSISSLCCLFTHMNSALSSVVIVCVCMCVFFNSVMYTHAKGEWVNQTQGIRQCGLVIHGLSKTYMFLFPLITTRKVIRKVTEARSAVFFILNKSCIKLHSF